MDEYIVLKYLVDIILKMLMDIVLNLDWYFKKCGWILSKWEWILFKNLGGYC